MCNVSMHFVLCTPNQILEEAKQHVGRVMDCGGSVFLDPGHDVKSTLYCKHSTETTIMGFVLATSVRAHFAVSDLSFDQYVVSESVRWGNDAHWTCPLLNTY